MAIVTWVDLKNILEVSLYLFQENVIHMTTVKKTFMQVQWAKIKAFYMEKKIIMHTKLLQKKIANPRNG